MEETRKIKDRNLSAKAIQVFFITFIYAAVIEELIFRSPLFLLFNELNNIAWTYIILLGCVFGLSHHVKAQRLMANIFNPEIKDEIKPDGFLIPKSESGNIIRVISASLAGIFLGWVTINKQSIISPILWHLGINFGAMAILPVIIAIAIIIVNLIVNLEGILCCIVYDSTIGKIIEKMMGEKFRENEYRKEYKYASKSGLRELGLLNFEDYKRHRENGGWPLSNGLSRWVCDNEEEEGEE